MIRSTYEKKAISTSPRLSFYFSLGLHKTPVVFLIGVIDKLILAVVILMNDSGSRLACTLARGVWRVLRPWLTLMASTRPPGVRWDVAIDFGEGFARRGRGSC